ncbi:aldo/keto reductase [Actinomycetospora sp. OC33-EN08]|uniref:Aldo/keto reductase n=1 Tax=Actinomycetospora aurantiaca TaxID=3129233 RepID=A0ABU8MT63_9PSEU
MATTTLTNDSLIVAGKRVPRMAFGAMRLADPQIWGPPSDREHSVRLVRRAVELGIEHVDTADTYGLGVSEDILREALHPYPENLLISTKIGQVQPRPLEWVPVGHPWFLRHQCEMSLRRLGTDCIDLLYLHRADPSVPFLDQVGALRELQQEGKIAHIGLSEVDIEQVDTARSVITVAAVQNIYNLTTRTWDDVVEYCSQAGIPFVPWFPVMNGDLARSGGVADRIAAETNGTPAQVALAWLLARAEVMCPIPGTSSITHLEENVAATDIELSHEQFAALDAAGTH